MFDNREQRMIKMRAARELAADKERAAIELEKRAILDRQASFEKSKREFFESGAGENLALASVYFIGLVFMCIIGYFVSSILPLPLFWTITVILIGVGIYSRKKIKFRVPYMVFIFFVFVSSCSGSTFSQVARDQQAVTAAVIAANEAQDAAREAAHNREAKANHERRLAYNRAHPAEAAKRKADAKKNARIQEAAATHAQQAEEAATARYLGRVNKYMAITIDHSTYSKAVVSSPGNIDWYVEDVASVTGDIESQKLEYNYRNSFIHMVKRENPDLKINHERFFNAYTGKLLNGSSDEDVNYDI